MTPLNCLVIDLKILSPAKGPSTVELDSSSNWRFASLYMVTKSTIFARASELS